MSFIIAKDLGFRVSEGNKHHTHVHNKGDHTQVDRLLTSSLCSYRGECSSRLAHEGAALPETAGGVYKGLHLGGHSTEASRQAKDKAVVFFHFVGRHDGKIGLGGRVHFAQDFITQQLGDLVYVTRCPTGFHAPFDGRGEARNMTVHGVLYDSNFYHFAFLLEEISRRID